MRPEEEFGSGSGEMLSIAEEPKEAAAGNVGGSSVGKQWVWVKIQPPGYGPQVLVFGSIYQGKPCWVPIFDPQPNGELISKGPVNMG